MEPTPFVYNKELLEHIRNTRRDKKCYLCCDLDLIGEGAAGSAYSAYITPTEKFPDQIVLKEQKRTRYCNNEQEALKFLKEEMLSGRMPGYFVFMYGFFTSGSRKYIILEKADKCIDQHLADYNFDEKIFLQIFWHLADAVSYLEAVEMNHGDLWSENVMLVWKPGQENVPEEEREFWLKIIDYDSAFKSNSAITNPSYGGAESFRENFIVGYDLNRFFDSLIYSYEDFNTKKRKYKEKKIAKLRRAKKRGKKVKIPSLDDYDTDDEEFDAENIIYPESIVDFMYSLDAKDPDYFEDCPEMSGESIKKKVEEWAAKLGIDLF